MKLRSLSFEREKLSDYSIQMLKMCILKPLQESLVIIRESLVIMDDRSSSIYYCRTDKCCLSLSLHHYRFTETSTNNCLAVLKCCKNLLSESIVVKLKYFTIVRLVRLFQWNGNIRLVNRLNYKVISEYRQWENLVKHRQPTWTKIDCDLKHL